MRVAIFTDNDFDKTNGVTTTLRAVLRHLPDDVHARIYTASELCSDGELGAENRRVVYALVTSPLVPAITSPFHS